MIMIMILLEELVAEGRFRYYMYVSHSHHYCWKLELDEPGREQISWISLNMNMRRGGGGFDGLSLSLPSTYTN